MALAAMSEYFKTLTVKCAERYTLKIAEINGFDPYSIPSAEFVQDFTILPKITYPYLVNYLVYMKSFYTSKDFKAYKSLEACNQFSCGWVRHFGSKKYVALTMLRSRSKDTIRGGPDIVRNCWSLLQATALRGDTELARKMLACLSECGYAVISNVLLGPLVRSHINRNDLEGAVRELQYCVTKYRFTPLAHELTTALLRAPDDASENNRITLETSNRLIQDVLACMESKHGSNNTLILLLVALAEVGKIEQLERLVKDSGRRINQASLKGRCERLVKEDKLETLQNIVAVFKQYRWFDASPYLEFLLQIHSRRGDCRGALALWNTIEEMRCEPGVVFRNTLSDFLTSQNYPVPPRVLTDNCEPALNLVGQ